MKKKRDLEKTLITALKPAKKTIAGITGFLKSKTKIESLSAIGQSFFANRAGIQFTHEVESWIKAGEIRDVYSGVDSLDQYLFLETLRIIDENPSEMEKIDAAKKLFKFATSRKLDNNSRVFIKHASKIIASLEAGELLILAQLDAVITEFEGDVKKSFPILGSDQRTSHPMVVMREVFQRAAIGVDSLNKKYIDSLIAKGLIKEVCARIGSMDQHVLNSFISEDGVKIINLLKESN